jgi:hypothetical protein
MDAREVVTRLSRFTGRMAGTDPERRAAAWLREELRDRGEQVSFETVWVRPYWAATHALHAALAVAGSALSVPSPVAGVAVLGVALASLLGDLSGRLFLLRRLTPRRATQNVVASPAERAPADAERWRLRLVLTANLDAGRGGSAYGDGWVRAEARLRRLLGGHLASPLGLAALTIVLLEGLAVDRLLGGGGSTLGAVQLVPTVLMLVGFAALIDIALSSATPGANANASGVATALATLDALRREPPSHLDVHLLLAGAGEAGALGARAFLSGRRRTPGWRREDVALVALEPCGVGAPRYFTHEGALIAARLHPRLVAEARAAADSEPHLAARPYRSHGPGAARAARRLRWPSLALGALDERDRPGPARQPQDVADGVQSDALAASLEFTLVFIARLDAAVGRGSGAAREDGPVPV